MNRILNLASTMRDIVRAYRDPQYNQGTAYERFMVLNSDPYNLCDEWDEDNCPTPAGMAKAEAFIARAKKWGEVRWWIYDKRRTAGAVWRVLICEWKGHDWKDESYGGPDSGCMAGSCQRCGYSFHHQLY